MEYRKVGKAGIRVSEIGLGAWLTFGASVDEGTTRRCVKAAVDNGVNFLDNADMYAKGEAERVVGRVIRNLGLRRPEVCSAVTGATRPEHVLSNVRAAGVTLAPDVLEEIERILSE